MSEKDMKLKAINVAELLRLPLRPRAKRGGGAIRYVDQNVEVCGEELDEIWWSGRQWAVTAYGIEALDGTYHIEADRLYEGLASHSWPEHIGEKIWTDNDDFVTAWLVAISLHSKRGKEMRTAIHRAAAQKEEDEKWPR
jgi:hypothetical protein